MSNIRTVYHRIAIQPRAVKATLTIALFILSLLSLSVGVGAASLTESIQVALKGKNASPIIIGSNDKSNNVPTTLKVEIIRNNKTICQGENTPNVNSALDRFSIERPIADCPRLQVGDKVRATWIQQNEVDISFRD